MDIFLTAIVAFVVGIGLGASGYRYYLKRDPLKVEQWADDIRAAKASVGKRFE